MSKYAARFKEKSTWVGLIALAAALGVDISQYQEIVQGIAVVCGAYLVAVKESREA